jgi:hypothetical protein
LEKIAQQPELGEKLVTKLRAGMMPPAGMPRPDAQTYDQIAGAIERELDRAARTRPNLTAPGAHRLNRAEYANAVLDLTGVTVDPATLVGHQNVASERKSGIWAPDRFGPEASFTHID